MPSSSRRRFLALAGSTLAALTGCFGEQAAEGTEPVPTTTTTRDRTATATSTEAATETQTATGRETTDECPPDIDERVTAEPPGDPELPTGGAWPQQGFDARNTGYNPDASGLRTAEEYWRLDAGGTPTVADGSLYNVFSHDVLTKRLTKRDPATATVQTTTDLVEYGVTDSPAVGPDNVHVSTFTRPFAVARDGGIAWEGPIVDGMDAPPTVDGDRIAVNGTGYSGRNNPPSSALLDSDGETRWRRELEHETVGMPAFADETLVVATEQAVLAVDPGADEDRWRRHTIDPTGTPTVAHGRVYLSTETGIHALALDDGSTVWSVETDASSPIVTPERVIVGSDDAGVLALAADTGEKVWEQYHGGPPMAGAGDVIYTAANARVTALDRESGSRLWWYDTPAVQVSDVISAGVYGVTPVDGAIYVRAADALHGVGPAE